MVNITEYKKSINELKNELYNIYFLDKQTSDYEKLIKLNDIDSKLHETLLIIHNNYITTHKEQNLTSFKLVNKLLEINLEMANHIESIENKIQAKEEKEEASKGWLTPMNITKLAVPVVGIIFAFWLMHYLSDSSFSAATSFFNSLIGSSSGSSQGATP